ncbi:MAG: AI-2E family transporter [Thermoguttaceae bacterium]|nr:AI-2E family transporter [Thermoguttaceae bacterium]
MTDYSENDKLPEERGGDCCEKQGVLKDYAVVLAAAIVILGGIHASRSILGPIFLAAFFSAMLVAPLRWLRSKGFSQSFALTAVIIFVLTLGLGTVTVVGAQLTQFAKDIPTYRDRFNSELDNYNLNLGDFIPFLKEDDPETPEPAEAVDEDSDVAFERRVRREVERRRAFEEAKKTTDRAPDVSATRLKAEAAPRVAWEDELKRENFIVPAAYRQQEQNVDGESEKSGLTPTLADGSGVLTASDDPEGLIPRSATSTLLDGEKNEPDVAPLADAAADDEEGGEPDAEFAVEPLADETLDEAEEDAVRAAWKSAPPVGVVDAGANELFRFLAGLASELSYLASNGFILTLLVIFMLCETASMPKKMAAALGKRGFVNEHIQKVVADIRHYMVIKTWMSLGVGFCVTLLLVVSDVQYPLLWGFVAFLLNYIPNIGSVVAAIPPIVLATVEHGLVVGAVDAVFFVVINCAIGYGIEPRLLGNGLDLSPLIVLIALILFGWLLGPIGMFLSPPLAVIMKIIFQSFPETRWIAVMMANRPPKDADEETVESA